MPGDGPRRPLVYAEYNLLPPKAQWAIVLALAAYAEAYDARCDVEATTNNLKSLVPTQSWRDWMGDADLSQVRQARSNKVAWGQFPVRGSKHLQVQYEKTRANLQQDTSATPSREQDAEGATYARNKTYKYLETQMVSHIQAGTTFKKIAVSTLKQWVFILHECLKMNLVDAMGRLVTQYGKLANVLKVKATKPITAPKRKRKRQEHNSNTPEPAATPADGSVLTQMVKWVQFGTVAEKAVSCW
jgi:hypothetical protein